MWWENFFMGLNWLGSIFMVYKSTGAHGTSSLLQFNQVVVISVCERIHRPSYPSLLLQLFMFCAARGNRPSLQKEQIIALILRQTQYQKSENKIYILVSWNKYSVMMWPTAQQRCECHPGHTPWKCVPFLLSSSLLNLTHWIPESVFAMTDSEKNR